VFEKAKVTMVDEIWQFLKTPPLPDHPSSPPPPPLRIVVLAQADLAPWKALLATEAFAAWDDTALICGPSDPRGASVGVVPDPMDKESPRWILTRGQEVLAQGRALPEAKALATTLEGAATSRLHRISAYIAKNPDHLGARQLRREILLARMPNPWLEAQLAEDCLLTLLPPLTRPAGWTPDAALWQWAAMKALPQVEQRLESWPRESWYWEAWLGWADLHPQSHSLHRMAEGLPIWPPGVPLRWLLRKEVHAVIAKELRRQGRLEDMREWFQAAWLAQASQSLKEEKGAHGGAPFEEFLNKWRREVLENIVAPLREALIALHRDAELLALDREVTQWIGESPKGTGK